VQHLLWYLLECFPTLKDLGCSTFKGKPNCLRKIVIFNLNLVCRYYWKVWAPLVTFLIPSIIPWYFWNEKYSVCWHACNMLRVCISLHGASSVNSAAHKWGTKPYDK
jgi:stearoyl-CoA desaturase (delta-9 desaturase)